jgi:hypothetical protein
VVEQVLVGIKVQTMEAWILKQAPWENSVATEKKILL